jgi:hypothetical protein
MAFCFAHATVEATGTCDDCKKPICNKCTKGTLDGFMCPACAQKRYGRRNLMVWVKILGVAVALVGLAAFGLVIVGKGSERSATKLDAGTGEKDQYIQILRETRDLAPCDQGAVRKLVLELMEHHRYADVVDDATAPKRQPLPVGTPYRAWRKPVKAGGLIRMPEPDRFRLQIGYAIAKP